MIRILFIALSMIPATGSFSRDVQELSKDTGPEIPANGSDSLKIEKLYQLAWYRLDVDGDAGAADSISNIALEIAERSRDPHLVFLACNRYAETNDLKANNRKAGSLLMKAERLSWDERDPASAFRMNRNLAEVFLAARDYDRALEYGYRLLSLADVKGNDTMRIEGFLCIGRSLDGKNRKLEAFRNYLNAAGLAEKCMNVRSKIECYSRLSDFYAFTAGMFDKATHYKLLQRDLITNSRPVDSVALMWSEYDLQHIDLKADNAGMQEANMQEVLDFALRHNNRRMLKFEIALIRTHYIESDEIGPLKDLYINKVPFEFQHLTISDPALWFRLKAFFCEEERKTDSALFYFGMAEKTLAASPNLTLRSNFYSRYGQFLLRNGNPDRAIGMFVKSFDLADSAKYIEYMLNAARRLEELYAEKNDYKNAFRFAVTNKILSDSVANMAEKDQLLMLEIDHETRQRELAADLERQKTLRRHSLQYNAMIIGILAVFLVLIMLGSLRVQEWIIRSLGFLSFIFLFEFIVLLADHKIEDVTHGEPWKVLLIKIVLIAFLLPLHHAVEKKVIAYLLNHKLLDISRFATVTGWKEQVRRFGKRRKSERVNK